MLDFISTNTLRDFAPFKIHHGDGHYFTTNILKQNSIIYCKYEYLQELFLQLRFSNRKYILISHASDYPIDEKMFLQRSTCIKKWFAQNATYSHADLIPIPIGLGPHKDSDAWPIGPDGKQYTIWLAENIEKLQSNSKNLKKVYCNWNINTTPNRKGILTKLKNAKIEYFWGRNEVEENVDNKHLSFYDYYEQMSKCQFVISPPGNGMDCHRTWEALYMGCFPVVIKNPFWEGFKELPIIQVKDYSELTYDLLNSFLGKEYNYEKIYMKYWENRITNELNKL